MRALAAVLPLAFALAVAAILGRRRDDWRQVVLETAIVWGVGVVVVTEGLGALGALAFGPAALAWGLLGALAALPALTGRPRRPGGGARRALPWPIPWPVVGVATVMAIAGVIALVAPPNTFDSMTYHMSRVAHWARNGSVAHYPTHITFQLSHPPWAEFAILQFQILTGGDRLANLVQWASMVGSAIGASLIAARLGAGTRAQLATAVVAATIPMGILQASSTQNDYAVAFWLVCFVAHVLARDRLARWGWLGASLGLALLTKSTAMAFAPPFVLWLILSELRTRRWRALPGLAAVALVVVALNAPHVGRNIGTHGTPLPERRYFGSDLYSPAALASTVLRNAALHVGTPDPSVNAALTRALDAAHRWLGVEPSDWRTTVLGATFEVRPARVHEDTAGNPLHLALVAAAAMVLLLSRAGGRRALGLYAIALASAFLLFSLGLRWMPFHSRLQLPLFVLAAPLVGAVLGAGARVGGALMAVLLLASLPWLALNTPRPLVGPDGIFRRDRVSQYFANAPWLRDPYLRASAFLRARGCSEIGLVARSNDWEYPLWVLLDGLAGRARLTHVADGVETPLTPPRWRSLPSPCAIVTATSPRAAPLSRPGLEYRPALEAAPLTVLLPGPPADGPPPAPGPALRWLEAMRALTPTAPGPGGATVRLEVSAPEYAPGERLRVSLRAENPPAGGPLDLYAGALLPGGQVALMFFRPSSVMERRLDLPGGPVPMQALPPGAAVDRPDFFAFSFPSFAQLGTYAAFALLARPGAFAGDRVAPGAVAAVDVKPFTLARRTR